MNPIINSDELASILHYPELIIIHAGNNAKDIYDNSHITNAYYLELNTDMSDVPQDYKNGGRHPLPKIENFITVLQRTGIEKTLMLLYMMIKTHRTLLPGYGGCFVLQDSRMYRY